MAISMRVLLLVALAVLGLPGSAPAASTLELVQELGTDSFDARDIAVSPDGESVYAVLASQYFEGIVVFDRDIATGKLDFIQLFQNFTGGSPHVGDYHAVIVTPDGGDVLITSRNEDALFVFRRDAVTGLLTFLEEHRDGEAGVDGLDSAAEVVTSSDGEHVYVTGVNDSAVVVFDRDVATGALTFLESETTNTFQLTLSVAISPDEAFVYAGGALFARDPITGALTNSGSGPDGIFTLSPDGLHVYGTDPESSPLNYGRVIIWDRDLVTGAVSFADDVGFNVQFNDPWAIEVSPDGAFVHIVLDSYLASYVRDPVTGALTGFTSARTLDANERNLIAVSPDGSQLFFSSQSNSWAVAVYDVDGTTGQSTLATVGYLGLEGVAGVGHAVLSPDGAYLYGLGGYRDVISAYARDGSTGKLTFLEAHFDDQLGVDGLENPTDLAMSPDGAHLYATSSSDHSVALFDRDAGTGTLAFVEIVEDGVGGVTGIGNPGGVVLSPGGEHVYVTGRAADSVAAFVRDAGDGTLTYVGALFDGSGGVTGLDGAGHLAISPDGLHAYVAGEVADAVAVFSRDPITGSLAFVQAQFHGTNGVTNLRAPRDVVVSPDGRNVYVAAYDDQAVVTFVRDPISGALTFLGAQVHTFEGVRGLQFTSQLRISPDGQQVYAGAASFARNPDTGALAFIEELAYTGLGLMGADNRFVHGGSVTWEAAFSGCAGAPLVGCKTAAKGSLSLKDSEQDSKQKFTWVSIDGDPTSVAEFDPGTAKHYGFCLYDESGAAPNLVYEALIPAGGDCRKNYAQSESPCWKVTNKAKYNDRFLTPDGISSVQLIPSIAPKTRIKLKGKGANLRVEGLPLGLPLRAQLQDRNGGCWEQLYTTAKKNDATGFKAKYP